ncbi:hypothetical protein GIB67_033716 [Kingdonia uniflora]|uniref:Uncharacterized protein n=1 Tax=Kingdonia uniflora TaxID=39325 RepID=A0A7J7P4X7_9MAGN|nr:hypothetical protein GIB67_033716 [Kingdonia uniflora]
MGHPGRVLVFIGASRVGFLSTTKKKKRCFQRLVVAKSDSVVPSKGAPEIKTEEENLTSGISIPSTAPIEPYHPVIQIAVVLVIVFTLLAMFLQSIHLTICTYRKNKETKKLDKLLEELKNEMHKME